MVFTCVTGSKHGALQLLLPFPPLISKRPECPPLCHVSGALEKKNGRGSLLDPWESPWDVREGGLNKQMLVE